MNFTNDKKIHGESNVWSTIYGCSTISIFHHQAAFVMNILIMQQIYKYKYKQLKS